MNSNKYLKEVSSKLDTLNTSLTGSLDVSSTDLTSIVTNTSDTAANTADVVTNTGIIAECVDQINHHLEVDTNAINGVTMAVNSGNNSDGVQRITIANDDTIKGPVHTAGTLTDLYSAGTTKCFVMGGAQLDGKFAPVTLSNSGYIQNDITKFNGVAVDVSSGNLSTGSQRVCIATDDINLAAINTSTSGTKSNLDRVIYDNGSIDSIRVVQTSMPSGNAQWLAFNSGNLDGATQRVAIASNDVNISAMKTKLDQIHTILNDVWDSVAHKLKVDTT